MQEPPKIFRNLGQMSESGNKYRVPENEAEILPNLLGLTTAHDIARAELEGLLTAQSIASSTLSKETIFNVDYIIWLHKIAFDELYPFAGQLRTVNISKGGFLFPSSQFLPEAMRTFETEILQTLPHSYSSEKSLISDIAIVHAELLFIHPFREGNGRIARLLANMMARKEDYDNLLFNEFESNRFEEYVFAVQQAADKNYEPMKEVIRTVFSS